MLQFPRCYLSLFQVHTCTTKLLEIETALRCVSVCFFFFFLLKLVSNAALSCLIIIARDPALRSALVGGGGAEGRKERLQLRLWNLNICMEKVDEKC